MTMTVDYNNVELITTAKSFIVYTQSVEIKSITSIAEGQCCKLS